MARGESEGVGSRGGHNETWVEHEEEAIRSFEFVSKSGAVRAVISERCPSCSSTALTLYWIVLHIQDLRIFPASIATSSCRYYECRKSGQLSV